MYFKAVICKFEQSTIVLKGNSLTGRLAVRVQCIFFIFNSVGSLSKQEMRVLFILATGELQFIEWASLSGLAMHSGCVAAKPFSSEYWVDHCQIRRDPR